MSLSRPWPLLAASFGWLLGWSAPAAAAPQILALVATDGPVPLSCKDGVCQATLSALCLQKDRAPPASGQLYDPARAEHVTLVVTDGQGRSRSVPVQGRLRIESERTFVAVRFVLPEAAIKVMPLKLARGAPGEHYRRGWTPENQSGRPRFDTPVQNLPAEPVPGDLESLRSGAAPYPASPGGAGGARR